MKGKDIYQNKKSGISNRYQRFEIPLFVPKKSDKIYKLSCEKKLYSKIKIIAYKYTANKNLDNTYLYLFFIFLVAKRQRGKGAEGQSFLFRLEFV